MPEEQKKPRKRKSGGLAAIIDERLLKAMELKAAQEQKQQKPSLLRRIMGAAGIGLWMLFITAEFFHFVEHAETFAHDLTKWSPLFVGLVLLAPDAFDKITDLLGRLRGLRVSLPPKDENEPGE